MIEIGQHKLRHGDIHEDLTELIWKPCSVDILYVDPPWGVGNLKYWQTLNAKMTGAEKKPVNYEQFIKRIFSLAKFYCRDLFFLEYGIRWENDCREMGEKYGFYHSGLAHPVYGNKNMPLHLHIFSKSNTYLSPDYLQSIHGTKGFQTSLAATQQYAVPGGIVFDPCCGLGYSARLAVQYKMQFRGNELNSMRLKKTADFLRGTI